MPPSAARNLRIKKHVRIKAAELADKEASIALREVELTEAVDAMSDIFEAVETGEAVVENGKLSLSRWTDIIARMKGAASLAFVACG